MPRRVTVKLPLEVLSGLFDLNVGNDLFLSYQTVKPSSQREGPTWWAILEDALPWRARAPTPARIAASRNSDSARKKARAGGSGGGTPRAAAYLATSCSSAGTPAGSGDGSDGSVGMPCAPKRA